MADPEAAATIPPMGAEHAAAVGSDSYVPLLLDSGQALLNGFLQGHVRDCVFVVLAAISFFSFLLAWPILLSLKVDGSTTISWMTVWIPLWISNGIGLLFFVFLVSWGPIKAPPGWEGEWRDPYPMSMRVLELVNWSVLVIFQIILVRRLDGEISWSWEEVLSPLVAWACLRFLGELIRICRQREQWLSLRIFDGVKVTVQTIMLLLQVLFIIWRLEGTVDWSWWVVFIPLWIHHAGQMMSCRATSAYDASYGAEFSEESTRCGLNLDATLVTTVLAVALVAGGDFTAFYIFLPQFIVVGFLIAWSLGWAVVFACVCLCAARGVRQEAEGSNTV